jgi:hypothetical protein
MGVWLTAPRPSATRPSTGIRYPGLDEDALTSADPVGRHLELAALVLDAGGLGAESQELADRLAGPLGARTPPAKAASLTRPAPVSHHQGGCGAWSTGHPGR